MSISNLKALSPQLSWEDYFSSIEINPSVVNVDNPSFFTNLQDLLVRTDLSITKAYFAWKLISDTIDYVGGETLTAKLEWKQMVEGKQLVGQEEEQRCVGVVNMLMGDLLGKYYSEIVDDDLRSISLSLITEVKDGFDTNLQTLNWMDSKTKKLTEQKLKAIHSKVLYPSEWPDYSSVKLKKGKFFENALILRKFHTKKNFDSYNKPTDKKAWLMSPQTVNAYYNPTNNEIVIPGAILNSPFYASNRPAFSNYGALGIVLGHEITHGFDNTGRWFDANGTLRDWWSSETSQIFDEKAQCIVDKYSKYQVLPDLKVNGKKTEGENIADLGGIRVAYDAYKRHVKSNGEGYPDSEISKYFPEWTTDQLFFIFFAQIWCEAAADSYTQLITRVDVHSPARYRVLGSVSSFEAFGEAFNCPIGSKMRPEKECRVW